jgi:hypothetical protein
MLLLHGMLTSSSAYLLFGYCLRLTVFHHGRYTVNLVVFFVDNKLPEMPDRTNGVPLLPLSTKEKEMRLKEEKDSKLKDEFHKLLNGNHGDPTDRVT